MINLNERMLPDRSLELTPLLITSRARIRLLANIMAWEGIAYGERTQLVVLNFQDYGAGRYIDQVLRPYLVPIFRSTSGVIFQQCFSYSELSLSKWNLCTGLASPLPLSRFHRASLRRVGETYPHPTKTAYEHQWAPSRITSRMEQHAARHLSIGLLTPWDVVVQSW